MNSSYRKCAFPVWPFLRAVAFALCLSSCTFTPVHPKVFGTVTAVHKENSTLASVVTDFASANGLRSAALFGRITKRDGGAGHEVSLRTNDDSFRVQFTETSAAVFEFSVTSDLPEAQWRAIWTSLRDYLLQERFTVSILGPAGSVP